MRFRFLSFASPVAQAAANAASETPAPAAAPLAEQARKQLARSLKSSEARFLLMDGPACSVDAEVLACIEYHEACALDSVGRVEGRDDDNKVAFDRMKQGARLEAYNPVTNSVKIRVDSERIPSFWLEIEVPLAQLEAFVHMAKQHQSEEE